VQILQRVEYAVGGRRHRRNVGAANLRAKRKGRPFALESHWFEPGSAASFIRYDRTDRVTGGGFVRGSVLLVGGDPGIGKSTLLTQATSLMARAGHRVVYISGEEAVAQVRCALRGLGLADAPVQLAAQTSVEDIIATLSANPPRLVVIDPSRPCGPIR
jgi:DNA repair protein RadA/Sms